MRLNVEIVRIDGPAGTNEMIVENPGAPRGIALICHPHPLFGGTNTNKVIQTLARTFANLNYVALRPSFRGVGQSEGKHDDGRGETEDMLAVLADAKRRYGDLPVVLAGFSFGAYVQTRVAEALADANHPAQRLVLVGTAAGYIEVETDETAAEGWTVRAVIPKSEVESGSNHLIWDFTTKQYGVDTPYALVGDVHLTNWPAANATVIMIY